MPLIRVQYPVEAFSEPQKAALAEQLTKILLTIEGGNDTKEARTLAYVVFSPLSGQNFFVGGRNDSAHHVGEQRMIVDVTVPEASTTQTLKSEIHRQVNAAIAQVLGWTKNEAGINAWVIVHEIPEGHWGTNGETFGLARIVAYAKAPPEPVRMKFVQAYFKAKAKLLAFADFPDDTSGLMRRTPKSTR